MDTHNFWREGRSEKLIGIDPLRLLCDSLLQQTKMVFFTR